MRLGHPRLLAFMLGQFLGVINDNAFKIVISLAVFTMFSDPVQQKNYLSSGQAIGIVPFLLFASYAGVIADRFRKSAVLKYSKVLEIPTMILALVLLASGSSYNLLLAVLFLLHTQVTFFSPAKWGFPPEMLGESDISKMNGWLNLSTFVGIVLGSTLGAFLWNDFREEPGTIGTVFVGIAIVGTLLVWRVPVTPSPEKRPPLTLNPFAGLFTGVPLIVSNRALLGSSIGKTAFWMLGALLYLCLLVLGKDTLQVDDRKTGLLFAVLATGIGMGSIYAGYACRQGVKLGLVVHGGLLMVLGCTLIWLFPKHYYDVMLFMLIAGMGAGMFSVPLVTLQQQQSPPQVRGQVLATSTFFDMSGAIAASGIFWGMSNGLALSPPQMIGAIGGCIIAGLLLTLAFAPLMARHSLKPAFDALFRCFYKVRIYNENGDRISFPQPKHGVIFIANHISYLDGLLLTYLSKQPLHFLVHPRYFKWQPSRWCLQATGSLPFGTGSIAETRKGMEYAREMLARGDHIGIFPEGSISRTGHVHSFKRGVERIAEETKAPVIPLYIDGLWGSRWSYSGKRFLWKKLVFRRRIIRVVSGSPMPSATPVWQMRQQVEKLATTAYHARWDNEQTLASAWIGAAKKNLFKPLFKDSSGRGFNHLKALVGSKVLADWLNPQLDLSGNAVGIMLPASTGAALANAAVIMLLRPSANLNFSLGATAINQQCEVGGIQKIITSRKLLQKLNMEEDHRMICLEDGRSGIRRSRKTLATLQVLFFPARLLRYWWMKDGTTKNSVATILFSSGSTAEPKAIQLSHQNILSNIAGIDPLWRQAEHPARKPGTLLGILPPFHAFGFTVCLWLPMLTARPVAYHANPLDVATVASLAQKTSATILMATPTFAGMYTHKDATSFNSLKMLITGGEKLTDTMRENLQKALPDTAILQGYGTTECGPVVSVNIPDTTDERKRLWKTNKTGSVGLPIPGVAVRLVHVDTGTPLPPDGQQEGLLQVCSPARMTGYAARQDLTHQAIQGDWYNTCDLATIDENGFITITDRLARFSKIGGEMVPHGRIEQTLETFLGAGNVVVTSISDNRKGERLVVLYASASENSATIHQWMQEKGNLPKLWMPKSGHYIRVSRIPVTATGKTDYRQCRSIATNTLNTESPAT